jgi:putative CocE/NonD family hydrolase
VCRLAAGGGKQSLMRRIQVRRLGVVAIAAVTCLVMAASELAPETPASGTTSPGVVSQALSFTTPDGTVLHATIGGYGALTKRPLIVEDSPYAPAVTSLDWVGPSYNFIELQWRGTGLSGGSLDTTGTSDQTDLSDFLGWACVQPWSNGEIGLYGFSASAIVVYNAMHLPLPCVKSASLMAGTVDLYRDLLNIGGIPNLAPGAVVEADIGGDTLANGTKRLQSAPSSIPNTALGYVIAPLQVYENQTEDAFWQQRTFKGDSDHIPILADTSFYDVEPRGPFLAFNATKQYGSHLLVCGAHDGFPAGTPGPFPQYLNWFNHYLLGEPLSAANQPTVSLCLSNGSREQFLADNLTKLVGSYWPLLGTQWSRLYLTSNSNDTVQSLNDGSLSLQPQAGRVGQSYPFIPSEATETDVHTMGVIAGDGLDQAARTFPWLTDLEASGPTALTYTSPPLQSAVNAVGPASLDVWVSSAEEVTDLYVVVADVWPNGTAYPVATGALRTSYPNVIPQLSLFDARGDIVGPYNNFSVADPAVPGTTREYHVEILPIGNHFAAGHRIRVYILGTPVDQLGAAPGINTVSLGGVTASRLLLPTVGNPLTFQS